MSKKKREPIDPEHIKPEDRMKFEIAKELGLADKVVAGGWRSLTAKESGRIGGLMTKKEKRAVCGGRTHLMRRKREIFGPKIPTRKK